MGADLRRLAAQEPALALDFVESDGKSMCYMLPRDANGGRSSISVQEAGAMRLELMPGTRNVVRFPVELVAKPTSDLLRSVAPDVREVSLVAESFGLDEPPIGIRDGADRAMAERIAATTCWPEDARAKRAALEAMPKPLVERALRICREAREAGSRSDDAAEKLVSAELEGGYWLKPLKDASDYWAMESARRLIEAYAAAEEALGAERAVGFAVRGEAWRPFDVREEAEALFFGAARL